MELTIMPGFRVAQQVAPQLKVYSPTANRLTVTLSQQGRELKSTAYALAASAAYQYLSLDLSGVRGELVITVTGDGFRREIPYEVVASPVRSTRQLDGCWISLVHWSDQEARHFNRELKTLTAAQWRDQIRGMSAIGVKAIVIQNVFDSSNYVFAHQDTVETYGGAAFYPSKLYPRRFEGLALEDPLEVILAAADQYHMQVFVGVGLFAWFDFSAESLRWHKRVATELYQQYGHHPSFYAFYISEELPGSFYDDYAPAHKAAWHDVVTFFNELAAFIKELAPTKPIALAPNNIRFEQFLPAWRQVLANVDILLPFAFARDLEHLNLAAIQAVCDEANTHLWVDMEIFAYPFEDTGLIPKDIDSLVKEIEIYDAVENVFGYQYTGLLNAPDSLCDLGGASPKQVYRDYQEYIAGKQLDDGREE
ncbi:DUF4434 domain-containing protein [Lacticaseibacillus suihuaensis]